MELTLTRSLLRPWRPGDESSLVRHANNRNVWRNLRDLFPSPYTLADARRWIGHAATRPADTAFAVVVEDEAVGGIDVRLGEDVFLGTAEVGYWLGEPFWGRGIMTEAVRVLTAHAFTRLALHWLVVISMITTTLVAPAQAATDALQEAAASQMAAAMADMPCADMEMPAATDDMPCDCCTPASCDLSACLGIACLPELPRQVAGIPQATIPTLWNAPALPTRLIDTPLRPPIA